MHVRNIILVITLTLVVQSVQANNGHTIALPLIYNQYASTPAPCDCSADLYNCAHFDIQQKAQQCYDHCWALGLGDIHRLDNDNDGIACESLPITARLTYRAPHGYHPNTNRALRSIYY